MKKILFVSSEAMPYIKTGGLADVVGSLPHYIDKKEYDVRVILPKYACMEECFLPELKFLCHFYVNLNWRKQYAGIFESEHKGVHYYFVDNEFYFAGSSPYHNVYEDVEKFAYFSKAVLESLSFIDFVPDIIHCHDWQTGLLPVFLHTSYGDDNLYAGIKTVFSIHNMKFQGRWRIQEVMDITGLPAQIFSASSALEAYGEANYLKGGVVYADAVSTVSPTYANEIMSPEGGEGLHGLMSYRKDHLYGIVNGLDYEEFHPAKDPFIYYNYFIGDVPAGKQKNKVKLQQEMGLAVAEDAFLIGIVSRMTHQKGFDLITYVMDEILCTMDVQFVVLGTGEEQYENMFTHFQNKYPGKLAAYIGYSEEKAHKIYAACDAFLMPSLFEPCGLSQMIAMCYGTIPIVRETGGLKDTVEAYNEFEDTGTGFSFRNYNAHEMLHIIGYAYKIYKKYRDKWNVIIQNAMSQNFSWEASAKKYEEMYENILK